MAKSSASRHKRASRLMVNLDSEDSDDADEMLWMDDGQIRSKMRARASSSSSDEMLERFRSAGGGARGRGRGATTRRPRLGCSGQWSWCSFARHLIAILCAVAGLATIYIAAEPEINSLLASMMHAAKEVLRRTHLHALIAGGHQHEIHEHVEHIHVQAGGGGAASPPAAAVASDHDDGTATHHAAMRAHIFKPRPPPPLPSPPPPPSAVVLASSPPPPPRASSPAAARDAGKHDGSHEHHAVPRSPCSSNHTSDVPDRQCQKFCQAKSKRTHCSWCKCVACSFCS